MILFMNVYIVKTNMQLPYEHITCQKDLGRAFRQTSRDRKVFEEMSACTHVKLTGRLLQTCPCIEIPDISRKGQKLQYDT